MLCFLKHLLALLSSSFFLLLGLFFQSSVAQVLGHFRPAKHMELADEEGVGGVELRGQLVIDSLLLLQDR